MHDDARCPNGPCCVRSRSEESEHLHLSTPASLTLSESDSDACSIETRAPAMALALHQCRLYAPARNLVVMVGETGTGKTHLTGLLHAWSPRADRPFVDVTAAEFAEDLAGAQLFGHVRGAFTNAFESRIGLFAEAGEGTLLLDDLHVLPRSLQALLLRALARGVYRPVGGKRDFPILCRIVVGLRDEPDTLMRDGVLLPDLRYRLGHCIVSLPRLADRREDITQLAMRFLRECPVETGVDGPAGIAPEAMEALEAAAWPGKVRALRGSVQAAYLHAQHDDCIRLEHLPQHLQWRPHFDPHGDPDANARAVEWALWKSGGKVGAAATLLGVHRNTVAAYARPAVHSMRSGAVPPAQVTRRPWRTKDDVTDGQRPT